MNNFMELAELLESAAAALRKAGSELDSIHATKRISVEIFRVRARKACMKLDIQWLDQLQWISAKELLRVKYFGYSGLSEIRNVLGQHKMKLSGDCGTEAGYK